MTVEEILPPKVRRLEQPELWTNEENALATFRCSPEQLYEAVASSRVRIVYTPLTRPFDGTTEAALYLPDLEREFGRHFLAPGEISAVGKSATVAVVSGAGGTLVANGLMHWGAEVSTSDPQANEPDKPIDLSSPDGLSWAKPILHRLYAQGMHQECLSLAEDLLVWHPLDDEVACHRICSLEHFRRYTESDRALAEVLSRSPNDPRALYLRGRHSLLNAMLVRVDTGRTGAELALAEHCLRSAHRLDPHYVAGKKDLAQALFELGRFQEALTYIQDVDFTAQDGEEVRTNGLALLGELYLALDKTDGGARRVVTEIAPLVVEHSSSNPRGADLIARALIRLGDEKNSAVWSSLAEAIKGGQKLAKRRALAACMDFVSTELPK